jgi:hypothetical protein
VVERGAPGPCFQLPDIASSSSRLRKPLAPQMFQDVSVVHKAVAVVIRYRIGGVLIYTGLAALPREWQAHSNKPGRGHAAALTASNDLATLAALTARATAWGVLRKGLKPTLQVTKSCLRNIGSNLSRRRVRVFRSTIVSVEIHRESDGDSQSA